MIRVVTLSALYVAVLSTFVFAYGFLPIVS